MKKGILSVLLAIGAASVAHAQGVRLGLRAGINVSNYVGNGVKEFATTYNTKIGSQFGFHGGLTLNVPVSGDGFFSLQPEILYSQRGSQLETNGITSSVRDHYVDLPVLARINADGFVFEAGPQIGYLLTAKIDANSLPLSTYNRFNVGYIAGVGYQFASGPSATIRYNGGISALRTYDTKDSKTRHSVFQLSLGYVFGSN